MSGMVPNKLKKLFRVKTIGTAITRRRSTKTMLANKVSPFDSGKTEPRYTIATRMRIVAPTQVGRKFEMI